MFALILSAAAALPAEPVAAPRRSLPQAAVCVRPAQAARDCKLCGDYCGCFSNIPNGTCGQCSGVKLDTLPPAPIPTAPPAAAGGYVQVCDGGTCRLVPASGVPGAFGPVAAAAAAQPVSGTCAGGSCAAQARGGLFRRR